MGKGFYSSDRQFTDYVHDNLAVPLIYKPLNWHPQQMNSSLMTNADMMNAVDCFLIDGNNNKIITTQERFREYHYHNYTDFTIRFEREFNPHEERKLSEFFKLDADYFVYGIINQSKFNKEKATHFVKYAVIDLNILRSLFDNGKIVVDRELEGLRCKVIDGIMHCPVNQNHDKSSSFIPVDIKLLKLYFSKEKVILKEEGF